MPDIFDASKQVTSGEAVGPEDASISTSTDTTHGDSTHTLTTHTNSAPSSPLAASGKRNVNEYSRVMRAEEPSTNPFDAFAPKPLAVHAFDSQLDDEQILLLLRQHPLTQVPKILIFLVLALLPILFQMFPFFTDLPFRYQLSAMLLWYLLVLGFTIESFLTWFFNIYIVTDERIIDVDFVSLIYRNISAAKIDNVEDVTARSSGAVQSIFDYGTVEIQTAAERRQFEFEGVPHPNKVTEFINEMIVEEEREKIEGRVS